MASPYEPAWFSEATESQVGQLLEDLDCMAENVFQAVLGWASGEYQWYAGADSIVEMAWTSAERRRQAGEC